MMSKKFKLIIGLGNPGSKYKLNRHNLGFIVLDEYLKDKSFFEYNKKFDCELLKYSGRLFAKPSSFMNLSGKSVVSLANFYQIQPEQILVIQDELDLDFGKVKLSFDVSDAGHNGIKSITESLGTQKYYRLRFGIGKPSDSTPIENYVLNDFNSLELSTIKNFNLDNYFN